MVQKPERVRLKLIWSSPCLA